MSGPLVWTSYRDPDGNLVIELPNSLPAPGLADLDLSQGLIESARVEVQDGGDRPLTRLVIKTFSEAEHSVAAEGTHLLVDLMPLRQVEIAAVDPTAVDLAPQAAAPSALPDLAVVSPADSVALEGSEDPGTAESPELGPPPTGVSATQLQSVEVSEENGAPVVWIVGDGDFYYSTFALTDPARFVVDLDGVIKTAPVSSVPVSIAPVERVRVAQFKPRPDLIARVVIDLTRESFPMVERTGNGLKLTFSDQTAPTLVEDIANDAPGAGSGFLAEAENEFDPEPAAYDSETGNDSFFEAASAPEPEVVWEEPEPEAGFVETPVEEWSSELGGERVDYAREPELPYEEAEIQPPAPVSPPPPAAPPVTEPPVLSMFEPTEIGGGTSGSGSGDPYDPNQLSSSGPVWSGEPISMSLKDAEIKDVLRSFAQISDLNVVLQPGVSGTVTVELTNVPWDQALDQILKINGLDYQLEGNIMRIAPIAQLREEAEEQQRLARARALSIPLTTIIRRISYATAADVARVLRSGGGASIMSQRGSVVVDPRTNTLIIKELPAVIDTVIAVIENLDIPEPLVIIEARIIETTKRFTSTLGIDWGFMGIADPAHGNTTGLVFPNNVDVEGGVQLLTGARNGFLDLALGNVLNTFRLDAVLQAAENEGLINILSAPKIATLNNERASIQSGLQIPIQTIANNTVSVQFINATLRLDVTPHVTAAGTVLMDIDIQKREPQLAFAVAGATNAPIATKDARTRVIVRDGGTTVIGGIYKVTSDQGEDRVPGLSKIPILKHLFRNKRRNEENEELLIFITPRVVKL